MKSLLLKDLYNMRTNVRYLLVMMLVFAVAFIPNGYLNFLFITSTMFSVMMVSTFSYDEYAKWNRYALVMPIQKRDIVAGKFLWLCYSRYLECSWAVFAVSLADW